MANTIVNCSIVAKEALAILENMLGFASGVNRELEDEFKANFNRGYSPGTTINIKKPPRYTYREGRIALPQATTETTIPLSLAQGGCDMSFNGIERTLSLQQLEKKLRAALATVANEVDRTGLALAASSSFNIIGTPGTAPTSQALALAAATEANRRLDEMAAPRDKQRAFVMGPALNSSMVQGFAGLFNKQSSLSEQYDKGIMVDALGLAYALDQNVATHTNGTQAVAGTDISGANQTGSAVTVVALTGTITRGTKITLPGVFAVNPQSRVSTGVLAQFVVTADLAAGATSIPISPAIATGGAFQNVTGSPTNGSPFVIFGTASGSYSCNVAFHKDAFTLAMVPMYAPPSGRGVIDVARESYKGMHIKVTEFYDGVNDNYIMRMDVLFGWAATYPELSVIYAL